MSGEELQKDHGCDKSTQLIAATPDKDGIFTLDVAERAQEMSADISEAHITGTGHHVCFENWASYLTLVKTSLTQIQEED